MTGGSGHGFGQGNNEINICDECYNAERTGCSLHFSPQLSALRAKFATRQEINECIAEALQQVAEELDAL